MPPARRFDPGLLLDRDALLFCLAGLVLLLGASSGVLFGGRLLASWAETAGPAVWGLALLGLPVLGTAYLLGFGFVGFPFLESEWFLSRGLLSIAAGAAVWLLLALVVDPALAGSPDARWLARGVLGGVGSSLLLYTGLASLRFTLPARGEG